MNPQDTLNAEIARRDTAPPFVKSLTHDELVARHLEFGETIDRLTLAWEAFNDYVELEAHDVATEGRRRLQGALHPRKDRNTRSPYR